ncbi:hypothetical protein KIN20_024588 [Parelaphostrongylus tenuis]|uniref:Uncharacterized protein n=1 Tax=Parelaphostrongylus tenuis TaxID=148309 RepID=A0AAD5NCW9_PARTN|nr:hypothetical protein KIN20_024588 [Parelaphostrongylus tenuis]
MSCKRWCIVSELTQSPSLSLKRTTQLSLLHRRSYKRFLTNWPRSLRGVLQQQRVEQQRNYVGPSIVAEDLCESSSLNKFVLVSLYFHLWLGKVALRLSGKSLLRPTKTDVRLQRRSVHILDFGLARMFTNEKGELKTPRQTPQFKGSEQDVDNGNDSLLRNSLSFWLSECKEKSVITKNIIGVLEH